MVNGVATLWKNNLQLSGKSSCKKHAGDAHMLEEDMTKEHLISKIDELQQRILELEVANKDHPISAVPEPSSLNGRISESFVSFNYGGQQPVKNSKKYHISDLTDIPLLQQLLDSFHELTGIPHALLDTDNNILSKAG